MGVCQKGGAKGGRKSVSYYCCLFCDHRSQNRMSTVTHTRRHLNIVLACRLCSFTSESTGPLESHIKEAHAGKVREEQLTDVESVDAGHQAFTCPEHLLTCIPCNITLFTFFFYIYNSLECHYSF